MSQVRDNAKHDSKWIIHKFYDPDDEISKQLKKGAKVEDIIKKYPTKFLRTKIIKGNVLLNEGIQAYEDLLAGLDTPALWDEATANVGVGISDDPEDETDTGLQGATKTFAIMDAGYPQRTDQTLEWRGTYGSAEANHDWKEFTVVNAADDTGKNLNRKVIDKDTKSVGETWTLRLQITWS